MMEQFTLWRPVDVALADVHLKSLHDDDDGLVVHLDAGDYCVRIDFGVVVAFRSILEEACVEFWSRFHAPSSRRHPFWVVEHSAWLGTFSEADLFHYPGAKHYLVVTSDERIDVLCCQEPMVALARRPEDPT